MYIRKAHKGCVFCSSPSSTGFIPANVLLSYISKEALLLCPVGSLRKMSKWKWRQIDTNLYHKRHLPQEELSL